MSAITTLGQRMASAAESLENEALKVPKREIFDGVFFA
jgi:hypothetical protein